MDDMLSELEQEHYDRMLPNARHEFGHYAVARHLNFKTFGVSIASRNALSGSGGAAEIGVSRALQTTDDVRAFCEDRILVLSAGVLAEAMEAGVIDNERAVLYIETSGANDFAKTREHLRILHNLDHHHITDDAQAAWELNAAYNRLWDEASKLVVRYAEFIQAMADELTRKEVQAFQRPEFTEAELSQHPLVLKHFP